MESWRQELYTSELYHHGILGQKWGVRRYQNKDGSLTSEGKRRLSSMSSDKVYKQLKKERRHLRGQQYDFSNRFRWDATVGPNSEQALRKFRGDKKSVEDSPLYKQKEKELQSNIKKLDSQFNNGRITPDEYDAAYETLYRNFNKDFGLEKFNNALTYGGGKRYCDEYFNSYGKQISIAYIKDLGFDQASAEYINSLIAKGGFLLD